jgi:hypothetical protein
MTFTVGEGWAIVAALRTYAELNPQAAREAQWRDWAATLEEELRK